MTPEDIQVQLEGAIQQRGGRASHGVHVTISEGVASLFGRVPSWAERKAIERIARSMEGVQDVQNDLTIDTLP
ncbi:MAG: BON domain-containing protein [Planctomycetota bacterium]